MQGATEVRVASLEAIEATRGEVRLRANSGGLTLVFSSALWAQLGEMDPVKAASEPEGNELAELDELRRGLEAFARESGFETVLFDQPCGREGSPVAFDLVLRPGGPLAATTGYAFLPVVGTEHVARYGVNLDEDGSVESAYLVGAVAEEAALAAGDEELKVLSVRGRRCSSSRFELSPELWQVLSGRMGWRNVEPAMPAPSKDHVTEKRNL